MTSTVTFARSTFDQPRQYQPYNYYNPERTIAFDWELAPVKEGVTPVVTLSISHDKGRKEFRVSLHTATKSGGVKRAVFAFRGEKWADRRVDLADVPCARFSRKKLEEVASDWLAEVQANPDAFAKFFETDDSAAGW